MSVLNQSVKKIKEVLGDAKANYADLIEVEKAGKNRKTLIAWLEEQMQEEESAPETLEPTDVSVPDVEPVYVKPEAPVAGIDSIEGGEMAISELIDVLCQKRDRWQRSTSCGLENIKVHVSDIQISVS